MAQNPEERADAAVTVRVRRACPGDLRVGLLGEGKQIKAFGVFRKRLGVSFKDAEKGVALVAHEAGLDLG